MDVHLGGSKWIRSQIRKYVKETVSECETVTMNEITNLLLRFVTVFKISESRIMNENVT